MSEDEFRKKKTDITVSIDRSEELKQIEEENASLKETLKLIAEKEFSAKCKQVGLDPETATPEILKAELRKQAPRGGEGQPYWQNELGGKPEDPREKTDLGSILVDNTESGLKSSIEFLNYKKSHGSNEEKAEASRLLSIAVKHQFSKNKTPLDIEFSGNLKDLMKHEIAIKDEWSDEEKERALKINADILKKRTAWQERN
jgi:hypothetical protein